MVIESLQEPPQLTGLSSHSTSSVLVFLTPHMEGELRDSPGGCGMACPDAMTRKMVLCFVDSGASHLGSCSALALEAAGEEMKLRAINPA